MKKVKLLGLFIILAGLIIYGCKKTETNNEDTTPVAQNTVYAKWLVTGSFAAQFTSFEFNKSGSYIVVMSNATKFGSYTMTGSTMTLQSFGTIVITTLNSTQCNFTLTTLVKGIGTSYNITATKAASIPSTGNTALLCRTWSLVTVDTIPVAGTNMELDAMFTEAGTYFVHYVRLDTSAMSRWQWKDDTQRVLCYNWEGVPTCLGTNEVSVNTLTATNLTMTERDVVYKLVPLTIAKRSVTFDNSGLPENNQAIFGRKSSTR